MSDDKEAAAICVQFDDDPQSMAEEIMALRTMLADSKARLRSAEAALKQTKDALIVLTDETWKAHVVDGRMRPDDTLYSWTVQHYLAMRAADDVARAHFSQYAPERPEKKNKGETDAAERQGAFPDDAPKDSVSPVCSRCGAYIAKDGWCSVCGPTQHRTPPREPESEETK